MKKSQRDSDTKLSKNLSWLLRHGAVKEGLPIAADGFIPLESVLSHRNFAGRYESADVMRVVETDAKNRYRVIMCPETQQYLIKANQGHSIDQVSELNLVKIHHASDIPLVVHGTFYRHIKSIREQGLKRMNRNHIHFAVSDNLQSKTDRTSGIRHNCEVLIYIDIDHAMREGIEFYRSENNVVLSSGHDGVIGPEFFAKIVDRKTKRQLIN